MMMSFEGLSFVVPFGWVIAAVGVVIAVLAVSTAYALRKSSSGSIVQTLPSAWHSAPSSPSSFTRR